MSFSFGFYNALNHDRLYDAIQVSEIFDGLIRDGVYSTIGDHYVVKASENENEVIVGSGRAWFDHTWNKNDADLPITAPLPDLLMKRYDALVIDINANVSSRTNQITWVEGVPSLNTPVKPTLTNTTDHHQYPLCYILRTANNNTIIQDDIENTIGTDECPFVTGILQQVSISDLLLQWTSQFATFMNNNEATATAWEAEWEASMNSWTVEQKNEFATWMAGEKTEFDDWFANLHYILDGDVAGHLQNEIDAIEEGLGGSVFTIHTINSSLYGKTVTCTGSTQEKTAVFDASGNAEIKGITDVGTITFTATDGSQTAVTQISVPYFSNYPITMAFWAATVNLSTTSEDLKGKTITIRKGGAVVASTSFNSAGTATYIATSAGTYTFTCQGYSVEQAITEETTYNVSINSGLELSAWITAGSTTDYPLNPSSYANFAALEADEEAVRQLMLVHNAVDYLATAGADDALIEDIINSDICAKWINLSDYALDTLSANANIKSVMDTADKYGYGEWSLVEQVPVMTSNTAPSGVASAQTEHSKYKAYNALDGSSSSTSFYCSNTSVTKDVPVTEWWQYQSVNPIILKRIFIQTPPTNGTWDYNISKLVVKGSNDGTTFDDLATFTDLGSCQVGKYLDIPNPNDDAYLYIRYLITESSSYNGNTNVPAIGETQFYSYAPLGNVPIMTANNAPYGVAVKSTEGSGQEAWRAFAGNWDNSTKGWCPTNNNAGEYIGYQSPVPICVKKIKIGAKYNNDVTYSFVGSNDGSTWEDIKTNITPSHSTFNSTVVTEVDVDSDDYYMYHALKVTSGLIAINSWGVLLQFYGRELKPLVPTMTSNTTPKGTANGGPYSGYVATAYKAFDGDDSTAATIWNEAGNFISYTFAEAVKAISVRIKGERVYDKAKVFQASNDGFVSDIDDMVTIPVSGAFDKVFPFSNPDMYTSYRLYQSTSASIASGDGYYTIQLFGMDYSEKEFAQGSTRKTIYDHGVELETLSISTNRGGEVNKKSDAININMLNGTGDQVVDMYAYVIRPSLDITSYKIGCYKTGNLFKMPVINSSFGVSTNPIGATTDGNLRTVWANLKSLGDIVDVSSVNGTYDVFIMSSYRNTSSIDITEWWFE